jgi:hypothetical protein
MRIVNRVVGAVLRSPRHRLLSGSVAVIRWSGQKSGRTFSTPVQYGCCGDDLVILVGRPDTKTWWRNFRHERELEVLLRRRWLTMTGRVVTAADDPEEIARLLSAYVARFPRAARSLERNAHDTVVVWCRPT